MHEMQDTSIQNQLKARVESIVDDVHPSQALVRLRCGESVLLARVTQRAVSTLNLSAGADVWAQIKSVAVIE